MEFEAVVVWEYLELVEVVEMQEDPEEVEVFGELVGDRFSDSKLVEGFTVP